MRISERRESELAGKRTHLEPFEVLDIVKKAKAAGDNCTVCATVLAFNHAMRVSELAGGSKATATEPAQLPLRLVDIEPKHITIRRLKHSLTTRQPMIHLRGVPLMSDQVAIDAYLKDRIEDGSGLLFVGQKGPMTRFTLLRAFQDYAAQVSADYVAAGKPPIPETAQKFHALKHSCLTAMATSGKNILSCKDWAGHASLSSTSLYLHPDSRQTANDAQATFSTAFAMAR